MGVFPALAIILLSYSSNSSMRSSLQVWPNSERVSQRSTASAASPIDPLYDIHQRARSTESAGTPILRDILDLETRLHDLGDIPTYTNEDVCYVMVISDNSFDAARTQVRSWVLEVPKTNYFLVHHASDDSGALPMIVKPPAIQDSTATWKRTELAIQHLQSENSTQHCKWWFIGTDASWVNPRSVLGLVQELPFWRSYSIGYIWHEQGWSKGVTYSAGLTIYSRQALAVIASKLQNSTSECLKRADDFVVDACAWEGGVTQIHTLTMEPTGQVRGAVVCFFGWVWSQWLQLNCFRLNAISEQYASFQYFHF